MYSGEKFKEEMIKIFNTHNLKVDYSNQFSCYYFDNIPKEKFQLVENDIRNVMAKNKWVCQRVRSGNCITVRDINEVF